MTLPNDALEAGIRIGRAFETHAVPHALGGALAYGQYGIPRATNDVDVNVFVEPAELHRVFTALRTLGIFIDEGQAHAAHEREGLIVLRWGPYRVDVFTRSIPFSDEAGRTRVRHRIDGEEVWFLSAEALCVFKLLFFRGKDVVDLERLVAVHGDALDAAYVRHQVVDMMGEHDERVVAWDRIWSAHRPDA